MSGKYWALALFGGGLLLAAIPAVAHHSVAAEYDFDKPIEFTGTLKQMEWINPHAMLHLEVPNRDGSKTVWIKPQAQVRCVRKGSPVHRKADWPWVTPTRSQGLPPRMENRKGLSRP